MSERNELSGVGRRASKSVREAKKSLVRRALDGSNRQHRRYVTQNLQIDNPVVGRVVNVGQGGLAIESPKGLSVGQTYIFKIRLGEKHMRLAGRIQWCRLTATRSAGEEEAKPVYKSGVALVETVTSKAWQEALRRMTEEPAYVIWHRARGKSAADPAVEAAARKSGARQARQAG